MEHRDARAALTRISSVVRSRGLLALVCVLAVGLEAVVVNGYVSVRRDAAEYRDAGARTTDIGAVQRSAFLVQLYAERMVHGELGAAEKLALHQDVFENHLGVAAAAQTRGQHASELAGVRVALDRFNGFVETFRHTRPEERGVQLAILRTRAAALDRAVKQLHDRVETAAYLQSVQTLDVQERTGALLIAVSVAVFVLAGLLAASFRRRVGHEIRRLADFPFLCPAPIVELGGDGEVLYANPAARAFAGGGPVAELLPANRAELLGTGASAAASVEVEAGGRRLAWRLFPIDGSSTFHAYAADVTEQAQLEESLRHAQKLEAVGRLAGGIAHDFNNLLAAIHGYAELALEGEAAGRPTRRHLEGVADAAQRAAALTRQLLAFSRRQVLQPRALDPNELVRGMTGMLGRLLEPVEVRLDMSREPLAVVADPGQLEQVLMNLAVNARDAMPDGGTLTLRTSARQLDDPLDSGGELLPAGRYVAISATDTGSGIGDELLERIFEPFFTTKPAGSGTGLGLSMVYGIVRQSGGTVTVTTAPGAGTTFEVLLPATDAAAEPAPGGPDDVRATARGSEVLLLVEDEDAVRDVVRELLEGEGYRVLSTGDPLEALELARTEAVDLVVSDLVMPSLGGDELVERLRAEHGPTRAVIVSGYSEDAIARNGTVVKDVAFLQKPFPLRTLVELVRTTLDAPAPLAEPAFAAPA